MGLVLVVVFFCFWWSTACLYIAAQHDRMIPCRPQADRFLRLITYAWFTIPVKSIVGGTLEWLREEVVPKLCSRQTRLLTGSSGNFLAKR